MRRPLGLRRVLQYLMNFIGDSRCSIISPAMIVSNFSFSGFGESRFILKSALPELSKVFNFFWGFELFRRL